MFALCLMFGVSAIVSAQERQDTTSHRYRTEAQSQYPQDMPVQDLTGQDQDRKRIPPTELPDAVKRSLEGQEYRGWLVNGAYIAIGASDTTSTVIDPQDNATVTPVEEIYIVELKNGAETRTLRFDKDGKKAEEMDEKQGQNSENIPHPNEPHN